MTGQRIGYKRVSTLDQNTARQLDGIPLDKCYEDKASGKDAHRPQLQAALEYCREGDTLVVHSMDRLARNMVALRGMVDDLTARGIVVEFVKENLRFVGKEKGLNTHAICRDTVRLEGVRVWYTRKQRSKLYL